MQQTSSSFINLHLETPIYRYKQALEGISIECLVIVLYSLFPVLLLLGHAQCHFDIASNIFWTKIFSVWKPIGYFRFCKRKKVKRTICLKDPHLLAVFLLIILLESYVQCWYIIKKKRAGKHLICLYIKGTLKYSIYIRATGSSNFLKDEVAFEKIRDK